MNIVAVFDSHEYSAGIAAQVARIAANTLANLTVLTFQDADGDNVHDTTRAAFNNSIQEYISALQQGAASSDPDGSYTVELKVRTGIPLREILAEAEGKPKADLIILGCPNGFDGLWLGEPDLPRRIAQMADCSVLLIRDGKAPAAVTCCVDSFLDRTKMSPASLKVITQIVFLYKAELKIIGLTSPQGAVSSATGEDERWFSEIIDFFHAQSVKAFSKRIQPEQLGKYVAQVSNENMIGILVGEQSYFGKKFSSGLVERLVDNSRASFLILR